MLLAGGLWALRQRGDDGPPAAVAGVTSVPDCPALLREFQRRARDVVGPHGLGDPGSDVRNLLQGYPSGEQVIRQGGREIRITSAASPGQLSPDGLYYVTDGQHFVTVTVGRSDRPRDVRRIDIGGSRTGPARLVDGALWLQVSSSPDGIRWVKPENAGSREVDLDRATAANREVVARTTIADWLPSINAGGEIRPVVDCRNLLLPRTFSGLQTLSLVRLDLDDPVSSRSVGVMSSLATVHSSPGGRTWVAAQQLAEGPRSAPMAEGRFTRVSSPTQIHLFEVRGGEPRYLASGLVPGAVSGDASMDEWKGVLRVVTRGGPGGVDAGPGLVNAQLRPRDADNRIVTLRRTGSRLTIQGELRGIGDGDDLVDVRFDGALVEFLTEYNREESVTTVDLSDPAHPVVRDRRPATPKEISGRRLSVSR